MGSARISIVSCASRSAKSAMPGEKPSRLVALSDSLRTDRETLYRG